MKHGRAPQTLLGYAPLEGAMNGAMLGACIERDRSRHDRPFPMYPGRVFTAKVADTTEITLAWGGTVRFL